MLRPSSFSSRHNKAARHQSLLGRAVLIKKAAALAEKALEPQSASEIFVSDFCERCFRAGMDDEQTAQAMFKAASADPRAALLFNKEANGAAAPLANPISRMFSSAVNQGVSGLAGLFGGKAAPSVSAGLGGATGKIVAPGTTSAAPAVGTTTGGTSVAAPRSESVIAPGATSDKGIPSGYLASAAQGEAEAPSAADALSKPEATGYPTTTTAPAATTSGGSGPTPTPDPSKKPGWVPWAGRAAGRLLGVGAGTVGLGALGSLGFEAANKWTGRHAAAEAARQKELADFTHAVVTNEGDLPKDFESTYPNVPAEHMRAAFNFLSPGARKHLSVGGSIPGYVGHVDYAAKNKFDTSRAMSGFAPLEQYMESLPKDSGLMGRFTDMVRPLSDTGAKSVLPDSGPTGGITPLMAATPRGATPPGAVPGTAPGTETAPEPIHSPLGMVPDSPEDFGLQQEDLKKKQDELVGLQQQVEKHKTDRTLDPRSLAAIEKTLDLHKKAITDEATRHASGYVSTELGRPVSTEEVASMLSKLTPDSPLTTAYYNSVKDDPVYKEKAEAYAKVYRDPSQAHWHALQDIHKQLTEGMGGMGPVLALGGLALSVIGLLMGNPLATLGGLGMGGYALSGGSLEGAGNLAGNVGKFFSGLTGYGTAGKYQHPVFTAGGGVGTPGAPGAAATGGGTAAPSGSGWTMPSLTEHMERDIKAGNPHAAATYLADAASKDPRLMAGLRELAAKYTGEGAGGWLGAPKGVPTFDSMAPATAASLADLTGHIPKGMTKEQLQKLMENWHYVQQNVPGLEKPASARGLLSFFVQGLARAEHNKKAASTTSADNYLAYADLGRKKKQEELEQPQEEFDPYNPPDMGTSLAPYANWAADNPWKTLGIYLIPGVGAGSEAAIAAAHARAGNTGQATLSGLLSALNLYMAPRRLNQIGHGLSSLGSYASSGLSSLKDSVGSGLSSLGSSAASLFGKSAANQNFVPPATRPATRPAAVGNKKKKPPTPFPFSSYRSEEQTPPARVVFDENGKPMIVRDPTTKEIMNPELRTGPGEVKLTDADVKTLTGRGERAPLSMPIEEARGGGQGGLSASYNRWATDNPGKSLIVSMLPGVGAGAEAARAFDYAQQGNYGDAAFHSAIGLASLFPGFGLFKGVGKGIGKGLSALRGGRAAARAAAPVAPGVVPALNNAAKSVVTSGADIAGTAIGAKAVVDAVKPPAASAATAGPTTSSLPLGTGKAGVGAVPGSVGKGTGPTRPLAVGKGQGFRVPLSAGKPGAGIGGAVPAAEGK